MTVPVEFRKRLKAVAVLVVLVPAETACQKVLKPDEASAGPSSGDYSSVCTPKAGSTSPANQAIFVVGGFVTDTSSGQGLNKATVAPLPPSAIDFGLTTEGRIRYSKILTGVNGRYDICLNKLDAAGVAIASYKIVFLASGYERKVEVVSVPTSGNVTLNTALSANAGAVDIGMALWDGEQQARFTDFLVRAGFRYTDIFGSLSKYGDGAALRAQFKTIGMGFDLSKYEYYETEFRSGYTKLDSFAQQGGMLYFTQQNDDHWDQSIVTPAINFISESAGNDCNSAVVPTSHAIISSATFSGWNYIQPEQTTPSTAVAFDCIDNAIASGWSLYVLEPAITETCRNATRAAQSCSALAVAARGSGQIMINQVAHYQGTFGSQTDANAVTVTNNVKGFLQNWAASH